MAWPVLHVPNIHIETKSNLKRSATYHKWPLDRGGDSEYKHPKQVSMLLWWPAFMVANRWVFIRLYSLHSTHMM